MPEINDNLMPVLMQPVLFVWLFLAAYFVQRFFINRKKVRREFRACIALGIATVADVILGHLVRWETLCDLCFNPFYWLGLILLNVLFSIWYKPR